MADKINQPNDVVFDGLNLKWSADFALRRNADFTLAQKFVDRECIQLMAPYTPTLNGALVQSPTLGTVIGSGHIYYLNPYARYQYYGKLMVSSITGSAYASKGEKKVLTGTDLVYNTSKHQQAGPFWFDRMKADKGTQILRGVAKITGGTPIG